MTFPDIQGRCPACNGSTLFLADGGYITCSWIECPNPDAASQIIGEVADARQHGAYTFCDQLVGHVNMAAFATKISEKRAAYADAIKARKKADELVDELAARGAAAIRDQAALAQIRLHIAAHRPRLQLADPILLAKVEAVLRQVGELEAAGGS